jgi:hypothetical protein
LKKRGSLLVVDLERGDHQRKIKYMFDEDDKMFLIRHLSFKPERHEVVIVFD